MFEFGALVRLWRKKKKLTLASLAKKVGTYKGYISGIESGEVPPPSVKVIKKLAQTLRVPEKDLILIAYVEKAPVEIKKDLKPVLRPFENRVKAVHRHYLRQLRKLNELKKQLQL